jgi:Xaa-Pro aminopeptidase
LRKIKAALFIVAFVVSSHVFATERQPNEAYRARREALAKDTKGGMLVLFAPVESEGPDAIYGFRQHDNFYYLTGISEPGAALVIASGREASETDPARAYTEILFLPAQNPLQEKWTGPKLNPNTDGVAKKTGFERVQQLDTIRDEIVKLLPPSRSTVYTETGAKAASAGPIEWLQRGNAFPSASISDLRPLMSVLRTTKDAGEVALIRKATDASTAAHESVMKSMKPGLTEREVAALFQYEFSRRGCERPAYSPIVGSGFWGTVLHYSDNSHTIQAGDLVVMDVAGEYSMYASDITRTLPANGKFTSRQREIYEIVLGAQKAAEDAFRAGVSTLRTGPNSLHQVAADYINSHGKDMHGGSLGKYFIHGLSHYVGLNVHDPNDGKELKPGAVFTIEPGIYLPEEKLGVRIEDLYWVDDEGKLVKLSANLVSSVADIEKVMANGAAMVTGPPPSTPAKDRKKR